MAQKEFSQIYPKPGWVDHNPMEICSSQLAVTPEAMAMVGASPKDIMGIGITNQRETTIVWDKVTGEPVYNAIVWQCRRTAEKVDELVAEGYGDIIREKTGLVPDAYFSATKIAWILENVPGAREKADRGELLFGTVDSWLIWNLTKGEVHVTDYTNASRTMIYDIHRLCWDEEILSLLHIPASMLPDVKPSSCIYGYTENTILGGKIPIAGIAGDQQAALFGQCCFSKGQVKNTYGTGCFLLMNTGTEAITSRNGLLTTIAASCGDQVEYALEGSVFVAGAAVQWLRDGMRMIKSASQTEEYTSKADDTTGVYVVPAFAGMGAPYWNPYARGTIVGITRGCKKEHFIRATLESIAYQTYDVLKAMEEDAEVSIAGLKVDGGASANNFLMQFQADILQTEIARPSNFETTALGAAMLAGLSAGLFKDKKDLLSKKEIDKVYQPQLDKNTVNELIEGWKKAINSVLMF